MPATLDMFEYANDAAVQAEYARSDSGEFADQIQPLTPSAGYVIGEIGTGKQFWCEQGFQLQSNRIVTALEVKEGVDQGATSGNWYLRIETDNEGKPSGTLVHANATVTVAPPGIATIVKGTFATPVALLANVQYHLVVKCDPQAANAYWSFYHNNTASYPYGGAVHAQDGVWGAESATEDLYFKVYSTYPLQCTSEATIKTQGSYSLKGGTGLTASLNDTLTRTIDPTIDLTGKALWKFDLRALRTGANIKVAIHDAGGTTTDVTHTILASNEFESVSVDISEVSDANKDAIDSIIITVVDADEPNIFYIDNMRAEDLAGGNPIFFGANF